MKWGVRRYQNKDGTLTPLGRERYRQRLEKDFDDAIASPSNKETIDRIKAGNTNLTKMADSLSDKYEQVFKKARFTSKEKEAIWNNLRRDFGSAGPDNPEYYDLVVQEYVGKAIYDSATKQLKKERDKFEKAQNDYWDDVHSISDRIVDKYKDEIPNPKETLNIEINNMLGSKLDTSWNAYLWRHFDDYWIYDTQTYWMAVEKASDDIFSFEEYNKRFGK